MTAGWAQELAAEALTEVYRTAPQYDPSQASAQAWVMKVARRHIVSQLRAARATGDCQDPAGPCSQAAPGTLSVPGSGGGPQHQAVLLALYGGYTRDEISERLGLPPQTVAALIRDGLLQAAPR